MTRKIFGLLFAVAFAFVISGVAQAKTDKALVCHVTGSDSNPAVLIRVSDNAVSAHLGHGDYLLPQGQIDCSGTPGPVPE